MHCLTFHRSILIHDTNSMTYQFDLEMNQQNIIILGLNFYLL